ncbi:AAA family ATPase [Algoriphagus boritolerans]|uniref:AAA family ATPase n=1 Tax=Algoriphagus boritolerans TaxID=308111 RepID=UPI000B045039
MRCSPSGAGKTYSSLLLAYGLTTNWTKIAVIDTENQSADLYANLGQYNVISISSPHTPEKYVEAIEICENAGMEVIVIDSISHEWETLLDIQSNMPGNSFTNWAKITPRHNA